MIPFPTSDHRQVSTVLDVVLKRQPQHVLDIGVGFGKYGTLLREYLPEARIVGVEPWAAYGESASWWAYNVVLATEWPTDTRFDPGFDVCLMIDVIEHYPPARRLKALRAALLVSKAIVVATPLDPLMWPQDELDNPLERHYDALPLYGLADLALSCGARLVECHWLPDSYIAILERG